MTNCPGSPEQMWMMGDLPALKAATHELARDVLQKKYPRHLKILEAKLGLCAEEVPTLEVLGLELGVKGERARQLLESALGKVKYQIQKGKRPRAHFLADAAQQLGGDVAERARGICGLVAPLPPAQRVQFAGYLLHLLGPKELHLSKAQRVARDEEGRREEERARAVRLVKAQEDAQAKAQDAEKLVERMVLGAVWPEPPSGTMVRPDPARHRARQIGAGPGAGEFTSLRKGYGLVAHESELERKLLCALDRARSVVWFQEQPCGISCESGSSARTRHFPDALVGFNDDRILLCEFKPVFHMPLLPTLEKALVVQCYAAERGWGYVIAAEKGLTLSEAAKVSVPAEAVDGLLRLLDRSAGGLDFAVYKRHFINPDRHLLTDEHLLAICVCHGLVVSEQPWRLQRLPSDANPRLKLLSGAAFTHVTKHEQGPPPAHGVARLPSRPSSPARETSLG